LTRLGADVTLITGPTAQKATQTFKRIDVVSAQDMFEACNHIFDQTDIVIMSAAVADYRPKTVSTQKIKKQDGNLNLELEKTTDILASLGKKKKP
jgi:phosphopantothenoylcysteine decarboxylase/phosphopantothenate--cysteine ligase